MTVKVFQAIIEHIPNIPYRDMPFIPYNGFKHLISVKETEKQTHMKIYSLFCGVKVLN